MKVLLFFILIIIFQQSLACSCAGQPPLTKIASSDFVATVKILSVIPDSENNHYNDVDIEILELYKGDNVSSLKNYGTQESMCGIHTPKDSTWLIYAYKHVDGFLRYDLCTGSIQLDRKFKSNKYHAKERYKKYIESKLGLLEFLKDENIDIVDEFGLRTNFSKECLKDFNGIEVNTHRFALYELTIDSQLNIKTINTLKEFDNEKLKEDLLRCVNKSVNVYKHNDQIEIPDYTKIMVGLFYNPANRVDESSIEQYDFGF